MSNIINDSVNSLIEELYSPYDEALASLRELCEKNDIPVIRRYTESFLMAFIEKTRPYSILEIGTAYGYSSAVMAKAAKNCEVVSIDNDERAVRAATKHLSDMGLIGQITLVLGDGVEIMNDMILNGHEPFDFIFIDAAKSHYRQFFECALKLSAAGTVIICDNIFMDAAVADEEYNEKGRRNRTSLRNMRGFLDYLSEYSGAESCFLAVGDGISLSTVK